MYSEQILSEFRSLGRAYLWINVTLKLCVIMKAICWTLAICGISGLMSHKQSEFQDNVSFTITAVLCMRITVILQCLLAKTIWITSRYIRKMGSTKKLLYLNSSYRCIPIGQSTEGIFLPFPSSETPQQYILLLVLR